MAGSDSRIGLIVEERRTGSGAIKGAESDLRSLDSTAGKLAGGISGLAAGAGVAGLVALGAAAGSAVFGLAEASAQTARTRQAFENLSAGAGQSSAEILSAMQAASGGMVSNADLVQSANRAMLLGVADSGAELGKLLEVARVRGAAMGLSVSQAFDNLVTGLGRMSPLILDNLGIVTGGEKVFDDYAKSVGRTTESLSDAEKKQALLNKVISETQPLIDQAGASASEDLAAPFERMNAAIQNAKDALGALFGPAVAVVAQQIANAARAVTESIDPTSLTNQAEHMRELNQETQTHLSRLKELQDFHKGFDPAGDPDELTNTAQGWTTRRQVEAQIELEKTAALAAAREADLADSSRNVASAMGQLSPALGGVISTMTQLQAATAAAGEALDITSEAARRSISATRDAMLEDAKLDRLFTNANSEFDTGRQRFETQLADDAASDRHLGQIRQRREEEERAAEAAGRKWQSEMDKAAAEIERRFEDLKSKVSGVLTGALDPGVGVDPDEILGKFGLRPDAINENARRLADIAANGFKGQDWLNAFKSEAPDIFQILAESGNPQAAAAQVLKDFQDGLVPELIDKEKAKDLVRRMILGEQNVSAMAQEIATELAAEFGTGAPANLNELIGQALGTGATGAGGAGGSKAGSDAAGSFASSFVGAASQVGAQIAGALKADNVIALIKDAAKAAGEQWGNMFLSVVGDSVPAALVGLLTDLVTPGVQAKLAAQTSLTAAK